MFLERLKEEIVSKKLFDADTTVAAAVSGGVDSMSLLFALKRLDGELGLNVAAVNVEHGIRGARSVADSGFVREYCERAGVEFYGFSFDVPALAKAEGISVEECARNKRREAFKSLCDGGVCAKIALAHHAGDQAETVFMRIMRGTGVRGLSGMQSERDGVFARPFLIFDRAEIENFAAENRIPHIEDESNGDAAYTRNFIRNEVFPFLAERFPGYGKALMRLRDSAEAINGYIDARIDAAGLIIGADATTLPERLFSEPALLNAALYRCFATFGVYRDIEKRHIDELHKLIRGQNGRGIDLPFGITAAREYGGVTLYKKRICGSLSASLSEALKKRTLSFSGGEIEFGETEIADEGFRGDILDIPRRENPIYSANDSAENTRTNGGNIPRRENAARGGENAEKKRAKTLFLDADKIPEDALVRLPENGDKFRKFGGGSKKLCDYFTDIKIERRLRGETPVIASGSDVLAVLGAEISDGVKITEKTRRILRIKFFGR
ncbi:MAG: tRNA lysidine(34) synthetase TilS [Clostridiales bacterium]|jgi:tRNA(Ile)-lysidine synthase|nr:tRNA lysidine(34) synthetase TilS [Clostridiales bacterium]